MFRLTLRSAVELAVTLLLGLIGLTMLLGTIDEYKAGRAFNRAMDAYTANELEDLHDALQEAMDAKPGYDAPQEAFGKILIDEGQENPSKYAGAKKVFETLEARQLAAGPRASLPVQIGLAVAELEAVRARKPEAEELAKALRDARTRLEDTLRLYPGCGDLHVNLAAIALLENNLLRCKKGHIEKVYELGDVSVDALPFIYNLNGLVALRERRFEDAVKEFEKAQEFAPDWPILHLNLGAAQAQALLSEGVGVYAADRFAASTKNALGRLKKLKGPAYVLVCQALATYYIRRGRLREALRTFKEAEAHGKLTWHGRFKKAVAQYLTAKLEKGRSSERARSFAAARAELSRALKSPRATRRDTFVASCILGTIEDEMGNPKSAIAHFDRAAGVSVGPSDEFLRKEMPRVHLSLGALHYKTGAYEKAVEHLEKFKGAGSESKQVAALLARLRLAPVISQFSVERDRVFTEHDLRVSALLATPATPDPLTEKNVTLTLTDTLSATAQPLPFRLKGPLLRAAAVNLPQGRYRVDIKLADAIGNRSSAASELFEFDREPPRVLDRDPAPDATVKSLKTVRLRLHDAVSEIDLKTVQVSLRYPATSALAARLLVSRGKYLYPSSDGAIRGGTQVTKDLRCPVPEPTLAGKYTVAVRIQDAQGKACDVEWSFVLAP